MRSDEDGALLGAFTKLMSEALRAWDSDKDSRVGKMLAAFGGLRGYMKEIDDLRDQIGKIEHDRRWARHLSDELDKGDSWAWIRCKFEKCRTQFKWHTPRQDSLKGTRYEVMGWLHVLFAHADPQIYIDITMEHQKRCDEAETRAEKAEAEVARLILLLPEAPIVVQFEDSQA